MALPALSATAEVARRLRPPRPVRLHELEDAALEELYSLLLVLRRRERRPISDEELSRLERALDAALVSIYVELVSRPVAADGAK